MPSTAGIRQGGKLGTGAAPVPVPNPPLVEWRKPAIGGSPGALPALPAHRKGTVNGVLLQWGLFIEYYRPERIIARFRQAGIAAVDFASADPSIVKSIKQRDLLNTWLRLFARDQALPRLDEYRPERIEDELPDLVFFTVDTNEMPPRLLIESDGTRMSSAYGNTGKGRYLDEYLGARLAPIVVPVYHECIARHLPAYTIATIDDIYGRIVAYERLLLPFSDGGNVTHIIASLKTISEDGGFEIKNLMRGSDKLPVPKLRTVIDRDLFHRAPGRIPSGDVLEFG
jgi:hypothetical protein